MTRKKIDVKLLSRHDYQPYAENCFSCEHFQSTTLSDDSKLDTCHVDATPYIDGEFNPDFHGVYELNNPWGTCNSFKRKKR